MLGEILVLKRVNRKRIKASDVFSSGNWVGCHRASTVDDCWAWFGVASRNRPPQTAHKERPKQAVTRNLIHTGSHFRCRHSVSHQSREGAVPSHNFASRKQRLERTSRPSEKYPAVTARNITGKDPTVTYCDIQNHSTMSSEQYRSNQQKEKDRAA